jgi:hypothetical protein
MTNVTFYVKVSDTLEINTKTKRYKIKFIAAKNANYTKIYGTEMIMPCGRYSWRSQEPHPVQSS